MKKMLLSLIAFLLLFSLICAHAASREDGVLGFLTEDTTVAIGTSHGQIQSWNGVAHVGYDLLADDGEALYAPYSGTVRYVQKYAWIDGTYHTASYGNMAVLISDEAGTTQGTSKYILKFCHLSSFADDFDAYKMDGLIEDGKLGWSASNYTILTHRVGTAFHVEAGDLIGYAGGTGNSSGVHCHVELNLNGKITNQDNLYVSGQSVDPNAYITSTFSAKSLNVRTDGNLEEAYSRNGEVHLVGWAVKETDVSAAVEIEAVIDINGFVTRQTFTTDQYRPDVAGGVGNHGFDVSIPVSTVGSGSVSLYIKRSDGTMQLMNNRTFPIRVDSTSAAIKVDQTSLGYKPGDLFDKSYRGYTGQLGFAYWCESAYWGITSLQENAYRTTDDVNQLGIRFWMRAGSHLRLMDDKSIFAIYDSDEFAQFLMLSDRYTLELYSICWELLPTFLNEEHGGVSYAEVWEHVGQTLMEGECSVSAPAENVVCISGWVTSESTADSIAINVSIGGETHSFTTSSDSSIHDFSRLISTEKSGDTLVVVTAENPGDGDDLELYRGYVNIPGVTINRDCIICIDSPQGTYEYNASPAISGWIVSNVAIESCTASGISGLGEIDLTSSLTNADAELNAAGYGTYRYKQHFSGVIGRDQIINGTTFTMKINVEFEDGSCAIPASSTFALKTLVIKDGTNLETWFSESPGGKAGETFVPGETVYLCYRLTSVESGAGIDTAHPDYVYAVNISVLYPDGITRTYSFSEDERWIGIPTRQAGLYEITVTGSGDIVVDSQNLLLDVPVQIKPKTHLWTSYTAGDSTAIGERCVGGTYYGSYQLLDQETNLPVNQSAEYYNYTVTMEVRDPDGEVIASSTFSNSDSGSMPYTLQKAGNHQLRLTLTGSIGGLDASEYDYTSQFTVSEEKPAIRINATGCVIEPGCSSNYLVYKSGWCGTTWDYRISLDSDCAVCTWTSEIEKVNRVKVLKITGIKEGSAKATLELYDTVTGEVYATHSFYIISEIPTYRILFDANGGAYAPAQAYKTKDIDYTIPRSYYSYGGSSAENYIFMGWSTDPDAQEAEYTPGSIYSENAPLTLYAVWDHGDRYTYDPNGGSGGPSAEWHSYSVETVPFRLSELEPIRTGYIFMGWSLSAPASEAQYQPGDPCSISGNQKFYAVWAQDPSIQAYGTCGDQIEWTLNDGGLLSIQGSGAMTDYVLAGTSDALVRPWADLEVKSVLIGEGITTVGSCAFSYSDQLVSVSLPESLKEIGSSAFSACTALTSISIPDSVTTLGSHVFNDCSSLASVRLSSGLSTLPDYCFHGCDALTSLVIPGNIQKLGKYAVSECASLISLTFESGVQELGYMCTCANVNLISVSLPDTLTTLGDGNFADCHSLESITLPSGITELPFGTLFNCPSLKQITIPEGVKTIGEKVLYECTALTGLSLPSSLETVGENAFAACSGLNYIIAHMADADFASTAFSGVGSPLVYGVSAGTAKAFFEGLGLSFELMVSGNSCYTVDSQGVLTDYNGMGGDVVIPSSLGIKSIGANAFESCQVLTSVTLPASVSEIGESAFSNCRELRSVTFLGTDIASIGANAFYGCKKLESISIPEGVSAISDGTFNGCSSLTSVSLPSGIQSIGTKAFNGCTSLHEIELPDSLTSIGTYAFSGCPISEAILPEGIALLAQGTFSGCTQLQKVSLPESLTQIGSSAFYGCTRLESVDIPASVTAIGSSAFYKCTSLTEMALPQAVTSIESNLFWGCTSLGKVSLPANLTAIQSGAFTNCKQLASLNLPDTLVTLGSSAFHGSGITYISIPGGVTTIPAYAFGNCSYLTKAAFAPGVKTITSTAFNNCAALQAVTIPRTVTSVPSTLFSSCTALELLYTAEGCTAAAWFEQNLPDVEIVYLWGPATASGVSLNRSSYTISWLSTYSLTATVEPADARNHAVIWSSSDPEWVSVDENGTIKAHRSGRTVVITATTVDGGHTAQCSVSVRDAKITLYFDGNGGTPPIESGIATLTDGMTWGELPPAVRPGWVFEGWYIGEGNDAVRLEPDMPVGWPETDELTIHAHWSEYPDAESITLYLNKGGYVSSAPLDSVFVELSTEEGAVVSSSDPEVVHIESGCAVALSEGSAILSVGFEDGGGIQCSVEVIQLRSELTLPAGLKSIESEAFAENPAIDAVYIPEGTLEIGARAFADCGSLKLAVISDSVSAIAADAFDGCNQLLVVCSEGSAAWQHCLQHGISVSAAG